MKTLAAILVELGKPLELAELEIPKLKPGQVLVDIEFSGVCHTQLLECRGFRGEDRYLPHCLGHEGAGRVLEAAANVSKVMTGDKVVLSWIKGSGADVPGTVYRWRDRMVNAGAITTFGRHAVISENRLTPLPDDVEMRDGALVGCALPAGLGAVFNTAQPSPGQSIAIFGTGGVGLCSVMAAAVAGCAPIIAVDIRESRLGLARRAGATHAVNSSEQDVLEAIRKICPAGLDFAIEASGRPTVMMDALRSVRSQGGTAVIAGNARHGERAELDPKELNLGKRLLGTWGGDSVPDHDYPKYFRLLASGKVDASLMWSDSYSLEDINLAINDLESGKSGRPLVAMKGGL
jgi:S-(hydroxymethyl)glutathione dehydrogenase/alcohol dehydrogenase